MNTPFCIDFQHVSLIQDASVPPMVTLSTDLQRASRWGTHISVILLSHKYIPLTTWYTHERQATKGSLTRHKMGPEIQQKFRALVEIGLMRISIQNKITVELSRYNKPRT